MHFIVESVNGVANANPAWLDSINLPYQTHLTNNAVVPSVTTVLVDFRDPLVRGIFVYHCHILEHEDGGMMAVMRVLPPGTASSTVAKASMTTVQPGVAIKFTATVIDPLNKQTVPQGLVQFEFNGSNVGNPVPLVAGTASATAPIVGPVGSGNLVAFYQGDATHTESVSPAIPISVLDFSLSSAGATVTKGLPASASIKVNVAQGYPGSVSLSCTVPPIMNGGTCSLSPDTISSTGQVNLQVTTSGVRKKGPYLVLVTGTDGN